MITINNNRKNNKYSRYFDRDFIVMSAKLRGANFGRYYIKY